MDEHDFLEQQELPFAACEGVFDDQLQLAPADTATLPEVLVRIIKRDGSTAPFDKAKIARAIEKAAADAGEEEFDRAESLASGVAIYLAKRLKGETPTVEQVNDAVERVLVELGHGPTALAFARFRDRRARIRAFRQGNLQSLLHELAEARGTAQDSEAPVLVRTSDDALIQWDRERIVAALRKETGLEPDQAALIAHEVETQIRAAGVVTLTASLVRELVDAKLIEHGHEEARRRHARLGVPLFDAEQLICVPNRDESPWSQDPLATDLALAERVKREFALTHVHAQPHADAHRRGEWHLTGLGQVDRIESATASLKYVLRHGMPAPGSRRTRPPRTPESVVTHAGRFAQELGAHVAREVVWEDIPADLEAAAEEAPAEALQAWVRMVAMALAPPALPGGLGRPGAVLDIGQGPLALPLLDALGGAEHRGGGGLSAKVRAAPAGARDRADKDIMMQAAALAAVQPEKVVFEAAVRTPAGEDLEMTGSVGATAVLNLARAAYESDGAGGIETQLARLIDRCVMALGERRLFFEKLLTAGSFGPWAFLGGPRGQRVLFDLDACVFCVGVTGLNECVAHLGGEPLHASEAALELGGHLVHTVADLSREHGELLGMRVEAVADGDRHIAQRFAALDLRTHQADARKVLRVDELTQELRYTPGVSLAPDAPCNPIERVRLEGRLGEALAQNLILAPLPGGGVGPEALVPFIEKALALPGCRRLRFKRAMPEAPAGR